MTPYEIPLTPNAQRFNVTLQEVDYFFRLIWNSVAGQWVLDIFDTNNVLLIGGIPLIEGVDLLEQYDYLGFGGGLIVVTETGSVLDFNGLGKTSRLYFVVST